MWGQGLGEAVGVGLELRPGEFRLAFRADPPVKHRAQICVMIGHAETAEALREASACHWDV